MTQRRRQTLAIVLACASMALAILPAAIPSIRGSDGSTRGGAWPLAYLLASIAAAGAAGIVLFEATKAARPRSLGERETKRSGIDFAIRGSEMLREAGLKQQIESSFRKLLDEYASAIESGRTDEDELAVQLRRTNAELRFSNHRLREQDRMRDEYVALLSHELRTPLAAIRSYVEILCNYDSSLDVAKRRECLDVLHGEVTRCSRLVNDLLDMAQLQRGGVEFQSTAIDCAGLASQVVTSLRPLANSRSQSVELVEKPGLRRALADGDRVVQILTNLLGNAIKFTPVGGRIEIQVVPFGDTRVEIGVADSGEGIPPEEREEVFRAFYRGAGAAESEGCGLGLYLSRELAVRMNAELFVEDSSLGGVRFVLRLPAAP